MNDSRDWKEPYSELELLVRAAGNYVQASSDLRPRVLESARAQRSDRRVQKYLRRITLCAALVVAAVTGLSKTYRDAHGNTEAESSGKWGFEQVEAAAGDGSWGTVEAFTQFRRRQAEVLHSSM